MIAAGAYEWLLDGRVEEGSACNDKILSIVVVRVIGRRELVVVEGWELEELGELDGEMEAAEC